MKFNLALGILSLATLVTACQSNPATGEKKAMILPPPLMMIQAITGSSDPAPPCKDATSAKDAAKQPAVTAVKK